MADRKTKAGAESIGFLAILFGICIAVNVVGWFGIAGRLDLTEKRLFSLSQGTERLVQNLDDNMEIVAYFSSDLPPPFNATEVDVRNMLKEYEAASNGRIHVRFVNPDDDDSKEEAERDGVQKVAHQKIENDSASVVEGYRGIVFRYLGENKVIPVVEDTSGLEYRITTLIKEMVGERRPIGVLSGHEGPSPTKGLTGLREALTTYEIREVSATEEIPRDLRALLVVEPQTGLTDTELRRINQYVMNGGSLGIFGGGVKLTLEGMEPSASPANSNVNRLLQSWGLNIRDNIIADQQCGRAPMRTAFGLSVFVPYPPVPIVSFDETQSEHPVLFRIDSAVMPFTSSINVNTGANLGRQSKRTILARSSEIAWPLTGETIGLQPRHPREWAPTQEPRRHVLMVALEGRLPSAYAAAAMSTGDDEPESNITAPDRATKNTRVLVSGTAAFMRDEFLPPPPQGGGPRDLNAALALALNAVDWLAQDSDLIAIRAKNIEDPAINVPADVQVAEREARDAAQQENAEGVREALEQRKDALEAWDAKKNLYRWGNTVLIPLAFAAFGIVRWQLRRKKKASLKL